MLNRVQHISCPHHVEREWPPIELPVEVDVLRRVAKWVTSCRVPLLEKLQAQCDVGQTFWQHPFHWEANLLGEAMVGALFIEILCAPQEVMTDVAVVLNELHDDIDVQLAQLSEDDENLSQVAVASALLLEPLTVIPTSPTNGASPAPNVPSL